VLFNSDYNRESFLDAIPGFLGRMPDHRPEGVAEKIRAKSAILPPPLELAELDAVPQHGKSGPATILWNHRWEYDKNPEEFFRVLIQIARQGHQFRLSVLGQSFDEVPEVFPEARELLGDRIVRFGYEPERKAYLAALREADIAVSTAFHEYFGMALLEATYAGCYPLVPDRLVYREIFPGRLRYRSTAQLRERLISLICSIDEVRSLDHSSIAVRFGWERLRPTYLELFRSQALRVSDAPNHGHSESQAL
jgi:glycosyltransferase involved in cell wall biosynthesis